MGLTGIVLSRAVMTLDREALDRIQGRAHRLFPGLQIGDRVDGGDEGTTYR